MVFPMKIIVTVSILVRKNSRELTLKGLMGMGIVMGRSYVFLAFSTS